jgi:hypothetical protein
MTDPENKFREPAGEPVGRNDTTLFILVGLMALIVVGGLVYGLSHPTMTSSNPPQTVGSAASHMPPSHPR